MRKLTIILVTLAVIAIVGIFVSASVLQRDSEATSSTTPPTGATIPAGSQTDTASEESESADVVVGTSSAVAGAKTSVSLGFNNAEQVVENRDGSLMVWLSGTSVMLAERSSDGSVMSTKTIATGVLQLPSITRAGDLVAVGWTSGRGTATTVNVVVSSDGGATFGSAVTLGSGTALSLGAEVDDLVAVWHQESADGKAQILFSRYAGNWSAPSRIDASTAAPLWASVDVQNGNIFVTWRDNRDGEYSVWLRRSTDGGTSWQTEQHILTATSGDPDVCATDDGQVWVAHHGKGTIGLLHSVDNGQTFNADQSIGKGFFAHLSCTNEGTAIAWEYTTGAAKSDNKQAGWALYRKDGTKVDSGILGEAPDAAATAYLSSDSSALEILWVQVAEGAPLVGTLMHNLMSIQW